CAQRMPKARRPPQPTFVTKGSVVIARLACLGICLLLASSTAPAGGKQAAPWTPPLGRIKQHIDAELTDLDKLYRHLHTNPELSFQEEQSAARMAGEMKKLGWDVATKIGGHGVVAVLKNGPGPTVLVRCDMDGLPIVEATGLPY